MKCDMPKCDADALHSCCGVWMCELDYAEHRQNIPKHFPGSLPASTASANDRQVGGTHYQLPIQPWDFIIANDIGFLEGNANDIGFLEGNAIKYICRHRKTLTGRKDLEKAIHYLQKAIESYYVA